MLGSAPSRPLTAPFAAALSMRVVDPSGWTYPGATVTAASRTAARPSANQPMTCG
jgi:hypothetical protein